MQRCHAGRLNPVDHVQACLQAIKARPELNAFLYVDHDGALGQATALKRTVEQGLPVGPLAGVVVERGSIAELDVAPTLQHFTMAAEATQAHGEWGLRQAQYIGEEVRTRLFCPPRSARRVMRMPHWVALATRCR